MGRELEKPVALATLRQRNRSIFAGGEGRAPAAYRGARLSDGGGERGCSRYGDPTVEAADNMTTAGALGTLANSDAMKGPGASCFTSAIAATRWCSTNGSPVQRCRAATNGASRCGLAGIPISP